MADVKRPLSHMRKLDAKEKLFRVRKSILRYLVLGFLKQEGWWKSAEVFTEEAAISDEFQLCDNIDLDIVLQDYISYYLMNFNKRPQFLRKSDQQRPATVVRPQTRRAREQPRVEPDTRQTEKPDLPGTFTVTRLFKEQEANESANIIPPIDLKPLSGFLSTVSSENRPLAELVYQDIIRPTGITWNDVKGLTEAKRLLVESVVYPVRYPEMFTGLLEPWRGVLLHGPPGTGKTMLARAVAAESRCTMINVSCSTVVNKWRGDSEKIIKILFDMATYYSPSIIFIDEVETLASERSSPGEHEASRRLKSQLMTELDGIREREGIVFLLANSNMPWEIDAAMLRRLEKRIYIPLPDQNTREELFQKFLVSKNIELVPKVDFSELAKKTEGYSGSDIKLVCKEALMTNVRKMLAKLSVKGKTIASKDRLDVAEVFTAIEKTKPVSKNLTKRHETWQSEMGCS